MKQKPEEIALKGKINHLHDHHDHHDHARYKFNWKKVLLGVFCMILSTVLMASQSITVQWGSSLGYMACVILIIRGFIQFIICIIGATVQPNVNIIKDIKSIGQIPKRINETTPIPSLQAAETTLNYGTIPTLSEISVLSTPTTIKKNKRFNSKNHILLKPPNHKTYFCLIWTVVILRGIFGGVETLIKIQSFILIPVGDVLALIALSCVITPILAYLFFKDEISKLQILSVIGGIIGAIFIVQPSFIFKYFNYNNINNNDQQHILGFILAILAAIGEALIFICIQYARQVPVYLLILSQSIGSIAAGFIALIIQCYTTNPHIKFSEIIWCNDYIDLSFISILGISGYVSLWFLTKSAHYISSSMVSLLMNLSIVWGYILQCIAFQQIPSILTIIGAIVMLISAVINVVSAPGRKITTAAPAASPNKSNRNYC